MPSAISAWIRIRGLLVTPSSRAASRLGDRFEGLSHVVVEPPGTTLAVRHRDRPGRLADLWTIQDRAGPADSHNPNA